MTARSPLARPLRGILALVLAASAGLVWSAPAPASASGWPRPTFFRTVEVWDPARPPSTPPRINLTAACVRWVRGGELEAVFGYHNLDVKSELVRLDPDTTFDANRNVIRRTTWTGWPPRARTQVEDLGPQVTLFKPGIHRFAFALRFRPHELVAWQVNVPSMETNADGGWKVTVYPNLLARCSRHVPDHFAVVQNAKVTPPLKEIVVVEPPDGDLPLHIVAYTVAMDVVDVRVACSSGGELLEVLPFYGWPSVMNVDPLENGPAYTIELDTGEVLEMTPERSRWVTDIFQDVTWGNTTADVIGRCAFGNEILDSDEFWVDPAGRGDWRPVIENGVVVDVTFDGQLPGGIRLR